MTDTIGNTVERKQGIIVRILREKAYGFLHCGTDQRDYFFHQDNLENCTLGQLDDGDTVTFETMTRNGRVQAARVRRI